MAGRGYWKGFVSGVIFLAAVFIVTTISGSAAQNTGKTIDLYPVFDKMERIQALIDEHFYFGEDADREEYYIYQGMLAGLGDQYSYYMDTDEYAAYKRKMEGNYCGIGATVAQDPATLATSVVTVETGGPAEKAGVQAGDIFLEMDGSDVTQMELNELIETYGIGPEGSELSLKVLRPSDGKEYTFTVIREPIVSQTVFYQMLDDETGYIQITAFEAETVKQFKEAADSLLADGARQLIYDVRGNMGGSLNSAVDILDYILPDGLIVYTADKQGATRSTYMGEDGHEIEVPSAVLVNENSASAAEVFASAMRDYDWAELVGTATFGKGIVQETFQLGDGSVIKLTTTAYFTKAGYPIQGNGLIPDITVEMDPPRERDAPLVPAEDVQLRAALAALQKNKRVKIRFYCLLE